MEKQSRSAGHFYPGFADLNISIPGAAAWIAKYNRASLTPIHVVTEDILSIASQDVLPLEKLQEFNAVCSALAMHPSIHRRPGQVYFSELHLIWLVL